MKIAIITPVMGKNTGWGVISEKLAESLLDVGIDFTIFVPKNHPRQKGKLSNNIAYVLPNVGLSFDLRLLAAVKLMNYKIFEKYDIVHSLFSHPICALGPEVKARFDIPFVLGAQGTYGVVPFLKPLSKSLYKNVLNSCDMLITPSQFTKSCIISFVGDQNLHSKSRIIHNGVDFPEFFFRKAKKINPNSRRIKIISVGSLKPRKGFEVAIKAMQKLKSVGVDFQFDIIGEGTPNFKIKLQKLINELNLEHCVKLKGEIVGQKLAQTFHQYDIFLLTSINLNWNFEGFGIVFLEANAAKLAVVGSKSGGIDDAVIDGKTGLLAEEGNPCNIAKKLLSIIDDPSLRKNLIKDGLKWAKAHDWGNIALDFAETYKDLVRTQKTKV